MKILYLAITDPIFMESYHKAKNINILFDPVISVMAKHIFETSNIFDIVIIENNNINKTENILSDELENKISEGGVKILEKLLVLESETHEQVVGAAIKRTLTMSGNEILIVEGAAVDTLPAGAVEVREVSALT